MRVRRWQVAVSGVVVLLGLAGCGSDPEPVAASASGVVSAGAASSAAQPAVDSSSRGGPSESASAASGSGSDSGYDARELLAAMKRAVAEHPSTHLTLTAEGERAMSGEGDVSYADDTTLMRMAIRSPALGAGTIEVRLVDKVMYLAMPPMTPRGKFIKLDTEDPNSPFGSLGGVTSGDPLATFDAFDAGLQKASYVGEETVEGEPMDHYVLSVDAAKAAKAAGAPGAHGMPAPTGMVTYDLWLDDQDLMRRMELDVPGEGTLTITTDSWGDPVRVQAPPASAIIALPGSQG